MNVPRNSPVEVLHILGDTLRRLLPGDTLTINELASKTNLHWVTTKKYLSFINIIQSDLPLITLEKKANHLLVSIKSEVQGFSQLKIEEKILLSLYLSKATTFENGQKPKEWMNKKVLDELLRKNLLKKADSKIYLTELGILHTLPISEEYMKPFDNKTSEVVKFERSPDLKEMKQDIKEIKGFIFKGVSEQIITTETERVPKIEFDIIPDFSVQDELGLFKASFGIVHYKNMVSPTRRIIYGSKEESILSTA